MMICVSSSNAEPSAISKNRAKSFSESREAHSATFEGIETAERVICELNENFSLEGKPSTSV